MGFNTLHKPFYRKDLIKCSGTQFYNMKYF